MFENHEWQRVQIFPVMRHQFACHFSCGGSGRGACAFQLFRLSFTSVLRVHSAFLLLVCPQSEGGNMDRQVKYGQYGLMVLFPSVPLFAKTAAKQLGTSKL